MRHPRTSELPESIPHNGSHPGQPHLGSTAEVQSAERNAILRLLPSEEYAWLQPHLEPLRAESGQVLAEPGERLPFVYFPASCIASVVNPTAEGSVEVGTIGNEGVVGIELFLDERTLPSRVLWQISGDVQRMPTEPFLEAADACPGFQRLLRRYTHAFLVQVAQTAACNRMHALEQRCARWLLMTHDRVGTDQFELTQEFLGFMLGVHRPAVTIAARALQRAGLIRYSRGAIVVTDRAGLEEAACECYRIVRGHSMVAPAPGRALTS